MKLECYAIEVDPPPLIPARPDRAWMDAYPTRHAYRCLPLAIANTYGWEILCPADLSIQWNGGPSVSDIRIECVDEFGSSLPQIVEANFPRGIVTFKAGYVFRTDPGWGLLVTGPLNDPKDGISPLSGIVGTDWLPYSFTMNWQFTRPGIVRFEKGEPFCLIMPIQQHVLEDVQPEILSLESNPELTAQYRDWREQRDLFRVNRNAGDPQARKEVWQKFYFRGELPSGEQTQQTHVQKRRLSVPLDRRTNGYQASLAATEPTPPAMRSASSRRDEGFLSTTGGRIWHCTVGADLGTPLLIINGGPSGLGFPHDYLESLDALGDERTVVFYDQLGCGRSDRPTDPSLWTFERMLAEIDELRTELGLKRVHLLGHGFGAALAVADALAHPDRVESLTLASPCLSVPRWVEDATRLQAELPTAIQENMTRAALMGLLNTGPFQAAIRSYYRRFLCRREPWPRSMGRAFAGVGGHLFASLWGGHPLISSGRLRDFDLTPQLPRLRVPTLYTCGTYDMATPATTASFQAVTLESELRIFEQSSHTAHLEEPDAYLAAVRAFMTRSEFATH